MHRIHTIRRGHEFVTQINDLLIVRVRRLREKGITEVFWTSDGEAHPIRVERRSDADLYRRMMAAKGIQVRLGAA